MRGHGHVTPNADGSKARCGGPPLCRECALELARIQPPTGAYSPEPEPDPPDVPRVASLYAQDEERAVYRTSREWMIAHARHGTLRECVKKLPMNLMPRDSAEYAAEMRDLIALYEALQP